MKVMTPTAFFNTIKLAVIMSVVIGALLALHPRRQAPGMDFWHAGAAMHALVAVSSAPLQSAGSAASPLKGEQKYTFQLLRLTHALPGLDQQPCCRISAAQAAAMLKVLQPLRHMPILTPEDAKPRLQAMLATLSITQLTLLRQLPAHAVSPETPSGSSVEDNANPFAESATSEQSARFSSDVDGLFSYLEEKAAGARSKQSPL